MLQTYRFMPVWLTTRLRALFQRVLQGDVPLLFHCAAGKDRTGIAAALMLSALDVPRELILEDYALTNQVGNLDRMLALRFDAQAAVGAVTERSTTLAPEVQGALLVADPDYLEAALQSMAALRGSVQQFLSSELGVGRAERERLAGLLLA
jgi:protein-tyrosine phosphatase